MEEAEMEEQKPSQIPAQKGEEIISIRKKLAAPNDILPGHMIRSQLPIHLLPIPLDLQFQPGHQMLLAEFDNNSTDASNSHSLKHGLRSTSTKADLERIKTELRVKDREKLCWPLSRWDEKERADDPLQFLGSSLKNVLSFPQAIEFISRTALLGGPKEAHIINKIGTAKESNEANQLYIKYLNTLDHFGSATYAYDHPRNGEGLKIPKFQARGDLQFDDDFQSSNLYLAMNGSPYVSQDRQTGDCAPTYLAVLRFDYNTRSFGQWFYFKVRRAESVFSFSREVKGSNFYKFMIVNMTKSSSLFGKGLKVSVCRNGIWRKEGLHIKYSPNCIKREGEEAILTSLKQSQHYYTLEFTLEILEGEEVYISYNQPYTYSRIGRALDCLVARYEGNRRNIIDIKRHVICKTLLNNTIQVVSFSAKAQGQQQLPEEKKIILIMGRCHPVETAGSHVAEGILATLTSLFIDSPLEEQKEHIIYKLLENYVVKVIPMVNPDGVIVGNSRCNIAGFDLNRSWKNTKGDRCKEIYELKRYILQYRNRIAMFIDLHAHSKKKNVFAYGCHDFSDPFSTREFPFLLSKLSENDFLFSECRFTRLTGKDSRQKGSKEGTARVFLYDFLRIPNIFTIENSYCSAKNSIFHYDKSAYELIGGDILKAISLYFSPTFKNSQQWRTFERTYFQELEDSRCRQTERVVSGSNPDRDKVLNISLSQTINEMDVNVQMKKREGKPKSLMGLREQFIHELRANEDNIKVGLQKDEVSDSEEEERICQVGRKHQGRTDSVSPLRKQLKINDKLATFLNKTRTVAHGNKESLSPGSKTLRNGLSTHSEINLSKMPSSTRHRFNTQNKVQEPSVESFCLEQGKLESPIKLVSREKRELNESAYRSTRKDKVLSVVEIGLEGEVSTTHNYRLNLAQKIENKFARCQPQGEELKGSKFEPQTYLNRKKEAEVKDYLRKLVRPKQLLERRQRMGRAEKAEKKEMRLKPSNLQFSEGRLTRLLAHQGAYSRMMTEQTGL